MHQILEEPEQEHASNSDSSRCSSKYAANCSFHQYSIQTALPSRITKFALFTHNYSTAPAKMEKKDSDHSNRDLTGELYKLHSGERQWYAAFQREFDDPSIISRAFSHYSFEVTSKTLTHQATVNGSNMIIESRRLRFIDGPMKGIETVEVKATGKATTILANHDQINDLVHGIMPNVYKWMNSKQSDLD